MENKNIKYTFSGHESFPCKSLWLKKGYDFVRAGGDFNAASAVVQLGVGKNMVTSIRFWLGAFGMLSNKKLTPIAQYIFSEEGKDPFVEDIATLYLLHFLLVNEGEASIYNLAFIHLQREKRYFSKQQLSEYVRKIIGERSFNANTINRDISVFLQNYVTPTTEKNNDEFSSLLIDLNLIRQFEVNEQNEMVYAFNVDGKRQLPIEVLLFAIVWNKTDDTIPFNELQVLSKCFCLDDLEMIQMLKSLSQKYSEYLCYSDTAGVRQLQFVRDISWQEVLNRYYHV